MDDDDWLVCSRTWVWVGHSVIQLSKVGITIRMAHAQYGMLDEVSALKGSLQNKKLGPDLDPTPEILPI